MVEQLTGGALPGGFATGVSVVDFSATWCGPCKKLAPRYEAFAEQFAGQAAFYKADIDQMGDLAAQYEITGVPTVVFLKDGQEVDRSVGLVPLEELSARLKALL